MKGATKTDSKKNKNDRPASTDIRTLLQIRHETMGKVFKTLKRHATDAKPPNQLQKAAPNQA